MADYADPIGKGGMWVNEGKKGKFFSWTCTFSYNGHQVTTKGVAFRNDRKEGKQPDYNMIVNDAAPTKAKETDKPKAPEPDTWDPAKDDLPF
jgi:hypothetical protein